MIGYRAVIFSDSKVQLFFQQQFVFYRTIPFQKRKVLQKIVVSLPFFLKPIIIFLYFLLCPCSRHPKNNPSRPPPHPSSHLPPSPLPISISFPKAIMTAYMKSSGRMSYNVEMRTVITSPFGHRMRNAYRWLVPSTVGMIWLTQCSVSVRRGFGKRLSQTSKRVKPINTPLLIATDNGG